MGDPNNPLSYAKEILDSEPGKNLLSPVTKEVGEFLGTIANMARFYATENLEKIFTKWAKCRRSGRTSDVEAFKRVMPLLPLASMVSEDELQEKWAVLMESTATEDSCLPSFGQTLAQLTAEEVRYLDRLWKFVLKPIDDYVSEHRFGREPLSYSNLVQTFNPDINPGINAAEWKILREQFTDEQKANYERLGRALLVIEDLIRLGIIVKDQVAKHPLELRQTKTRSAYSFSEYGVSFMQAVTVKDDTFNE
jgi:hypothetical protein